MNIPYVFKYCKHCNRWLVANAYNFKRQKHGKYGLTSKCKQYDKEYYEQNKEHIMKISKEYYEQNKEHKKEYDKEYRKKNEEYTKTRLKLYREQNKELINKKYREWYKQNNEYCKEYARQYRKTAQGQIVNFNHSAKRRMQKQNQGNGITKDQWLEMMDFFNWKCAYSDKKLNKNNRTIDHIIPLNSGGKNEIWNTVPMYNTYNFSKHDKDMLQWYKEQTFFSEERLHKIYEWQEYAYKKWHDKEEII